jgi:hypothetical protein
MYSSHSSAGSQATLKAARVHASASLRKQVPSARFSAAADYFANAPLQLTRSGKVGAAQTLALGIEDPALGSGTLAVITYLS